MGLFYVNGDPSKLLQEWFSLQKAEYLPCLSMYLTLQACTSQESYGEPPNTETGGQLEDERRLDERSTARKKDSPA